MVASSGKDGSDPMRWTTIRWLHEMNSTLAYRFRFGGAFLALCLIAAFAPVLFTGCSLKAGNGTEVTAPAVEQARVSYIVDGDTVRLEDGRAVRYLGIDTPEIGEYYYEEATEKNREFVEGKVVELHPGSRNIDDYGRYLRYVYIDGIFVNAELVAQGYAKAYRKGPEEEYSLYLFQLEEEAKSRGAGLWNGQTP
jgi:micrococcal nuclease